MVQKMKNKRIWLVLFVVILAFGMIIIGCDNDGSNGINNQNYNGTWKNGDFSLVLIGSNYTLLELGMNVSKGTFSIVGTSVGTLTINQTHHADGDGYWYEFSWTTSGDWSLSGNTMTIGGMSVSIPLNGNWIKQ